MTIKTSQDKIQILIFKTMNLKNIPWKKVLTIFYITLISAYILWDLGNRTVNLFRSQGYERAVFDLINQAENENCSPFTIIMENKRIELVNVNCLQNETSIE